MMNAIGGMLNYMGIRWTNTDDVESRFMKAERALRNPVVWYAVNKIAGNIGQLPLNVHREVDRQILKPTDHFAYSLLRVSPNAYQTPIVFKRLITANALLWGNGYAFIHRVGGVATELIPMAPDRTTVLMVGGEKMFAYNLFANERISNWEQLNERENYLMIEGSEVLHIQGLGSDGICGYSLLELAADAWNAGNAATSRNLTQLRKGHSGGVVLEVPSGQLRDETKAKEFLEAWRRDNDGETNAGKTAMLREGVQAKVLAMSNRDAEFIQTLQHMRQEEALRFMLESILGDDSSVSYNSLEQKNLSYMQNCLNTWLRAWEEECEAKILGPQDRQQGYYIKFNDGALLRTDKATSMQTASLAIQNKIWTRNEVREMFDYNPVAGGDVFENPAITPGGDGTESDEESPAQEDSQPDPTTNAANVSVMAMLCTTEARRVNELCSKPKFNLRSLENFYKKWETTLADKIEELGMDRELATAHCDESKRRILAICNSTEPELLSGAIAELVSNWKSRANTIGELANA